MEYTQRQVYWIWLSSIASLSNHRFDHVVDQFGPPQRIWEELSPHMESAIGAPAYSALCKARNPRVIDDLFAQLDRANAIAITREDAEYPPLLSTIHDAPPTLYVRGQPTLSDAKTIAMVGARNCTAYGTRMARKIARELSLEGVTVVSGLARGIDGAAHRGAIDAKARTIAVLGSGVDIIYPAEHSMLADEILSAGGSIVSEHKPGTKPLGHHFPARNRIISGMCAGLLLVEAASRSGTMSTVNCAAEQGRDVFALPGQADSPLSASPHALIRDGGRLVTSAAELLCDMEWSEGGQNASEMRTEISRMTVAEQAVYGQLLGGPVDVDQLVDALLMPAGELNSLLTIMELQGIIRKLPGQKVERTGNGDMED